jgi:hypothetical protein
MRKTSTMSSPWQSISIRANRVMIQVDHET